MYTIFFKELCFFATSRSLNPETFVVSSLRFQHGDNVYFRENVEKSIPPNLVLAYDPAGIMRAYEWIRFMMASEGADYFTSHDPDAFKAMKKAPEFYE